MKREKLSPNNIININSKNYTENIRIRMINLEGKILFENKNQRIPTSLEVGSLETGIYFLEIVSENFSEIKKIVISR